MEKCPKKFFLSISTDFNFSLPFIKNTIKLKTVAREREREREKGGLAFVLNEDCVAE